MNMSEMVALSKKWYKDKVIELQDKNKRLKKALEKYGKHHHCDCQAILVGGKGKGRYPAPCSCGFEQALNNK